MGFQIHNSNKEPIPISTLDAEAATFWGKELQSNKYAHPTDKLPSSNWFDTIGWCINNPQSNWTSGWDNVKCSLTNIQTADLALILFDTTQLELRLMSIRGYLKPYFDLIDHWEAKGYKPVKVDD